MGKIKPLLWDFKGNKPNKFHDISEYIYPQAVYKYNQEWKQSIVEAGGMIRPLTLEGITD